MKAILIFLFFGFSTMSYSHESEVEQFLQDTQIDGLFYTSVKVLGLNVIHGNSSNNGGLLPAVQPSANIIVSIQSCATRSLIAKTLQVKSITYVKIFDTIGYDCTGPTTARKYSIQISSDWPVYGQAIVLNPIENLNISL